MATYLKRTSKLFDSSLSRSSVDISLRDLICPVCRSILIEPVTLPCTHNLCLKCLRGTFEHNSLSCPLCRIRVGSWLRTATKTETLVNNGLWELIRTKFAKEVEDKCNGDDRNIELNVDFTATDRILSAAGEIRHEYEAQLQMAEEEIRCRRKVEEIASEALIRKIQEEEQHHKLVQLAQDQLLAKSIVKKQLVEKQRNSKHCNNCSTASGSCFQASNSSTVSMPEASMFKMESHNLDSGKVILLEQKDVSGIRKSNVSLMSKVGADRYASSVRSEFPGAYNASVVKFCCQKPMPVYNAAVNTKTLRHQITTRKIESNSLNCLTEPGTSSSKIYGTQSKEELQVPNDVLNNSKKKSLGVEVCLTSGDDDERMGSAESADSINQEIHHFKPIKAMPRTPLKISTDGRQIDPKLIRVVPILKRISNVVPKPPSQAHLKRIIGCSWSAFRGKTKQISKEKEVYEEDMEERLRPSTSYDQAQIIPSRVIKSKIHDSIRKLDFPSEISIDSNKNYAKNINKGAINGTTKVGKKLTEEHLEIGKMQKSWKAHVRNGMVCKSKRQRHLSVKKDIRSMSSGKYVDDVEMRTSTSSSASVKMSSPCEDEFAAEDADVAMENIAERIKKRKTNSEKKDQNRISRLNSELERRRHASKRLSGKEEAYENVTDVVAATTIQKRSRTGFVRCSVPKSRQQRARRAKQSSTESSEKSDGSVGTSFAIGGLRKTTRKSDNFSTSNQQDNYHSSESCSELPIECMSQNNNTSELVGERIEKNVLSDEEIIKEQERMERLVIQEKEDFELAQRLQAKFDEMERIAGRTRRSRKAIESEAIKLDLYKIDLGKNAQKAAMDSRTAKPSVLNHTSSTVVNAEIKKRGRPSKRAK